MDIILAAAIAVCATTPENCNTEEFNNGTLVHVCDIAPEEAAKDINFVAELPGGIYYFNLSPKCENVWR